MRNKKLKAQAKPKRAEALLKAEPIGRSVLTSCP